MSYSYLDDYLCAPLTHDSLNPSGPRVQVGPYIIQAGRVYNLPPARVGDIYAVFDALRAVPGVSVREHRHPQGPGSCHYCLTVRVENEADGSLIFSRTRVIACGPGWCCYSHGPWDEYGAYVAPPVTEPSSATPS